jgi:predicted CoA-binding protein
MIVSLRTLTYEELTAQLTKDEKIAIWTCNLCIKLCGVGGEKVANDLAQKLQQDDYNVIHVEPIGYGCHLGLIRNRTREEATKDILEEADTIIVLTCTDGFEKVERVFRKKKVIQATATVGIGAYASDKGMRLVNPFPETGIEACAEGMPLDEVAKKLKMYSTPF